MKKSYFIFIISILGFACKQEPSFDLSIPEHFPIPAIPADNQLTFDRVDLGKRLFFDSSLSIDSTISCASCHFPHRAFSDTINLSRGVNNRLGERNAPSLMNVIYSPKLFRDGGVNTLEHQVISPIENPAEMNFQLQAVGNRLAQNPTYQQMSEKAYGQTFTPYVLVRALAAYERTLIGGNSRYDLFFYKNEKQQLSTSEQRGMKLFFNKKTNCSQCHSGVLFTDFDYKNNGIYKEYIDIGRAGISMKQEDKYKFKVPSLRNVELTAPYMHDGSIKTLKAVIEHYNEGGKNHPNQDSLIRPLHLTKQEQSDLVAFLKSLTEEITTGGLK